MKKRDLQFIMGILAIAAAMAGIFFVYARTAGGDQGAGTVVIERDGKEIARFPLREDRTIRLPETAAEGYNVLEIADGRLRVAEADCPEQICVQQGWISRIGEQIVCLPHRLVIRLAAKDSRGMDAVASGREAGAATAPNGRRMAAAVGYSKNADSVMVGNSGQTDAATVDDGPFRKEPL